MKNLQDFSDVPTAVIIGLVQKAAKDAVSDEAFLEVIAPAPEPEDLVPCDL